MYIYYNCLLILRQAMKSTGICSCASLSEVSSEPLTAPLTHPTLPIWTLQISSHLTPEPTNHLKERSAPWLAFPQLKGLEYCAGCCLKHKRRGRVAAERAGSFLPVMRSSRDLTLSLESSGVQTIQHPLGMSKYQSVPRKINYSDEGGSSYFLEG